MAVLPNYRYPPPLILPPNQWPRGTLIADQRRACAARPKGENEESPGWSLLRTERFEFFPATGAGGQGHFQLKTSSFHDHNTGSLLLSSLKKVTFPSFSFVPPYSPYLYSGSQPL